MTRSTPAPETTPDPAPAPPVRGYLSGARPRYRWVTCEWTEGADDPDGEPFRAEIRVNLTWAEIDQIDIITGMAYDDLWAVIAPWVRDWNAIGRDVATGELATIPPPAVAGPDAFRAIEADLTLWLAIELRTAHLGGDERGKDAAPPAPSAAPRGDKSSASPMTGRKRSRAG